MKAVTCKRYGPPEVLELAEVPQPEPAEDELLIRVRAVEVTKGDCEMRSFRFAVRWFWLPLRLVFGIFRPRRSIPGSYFSGEVAALGARVSGHAPGDAVIGATRLRLGACAEYLCLPASYTIARKPGNMSFPEAAAVPLGGLNALHFMRLARIAPGEQVLINGAGGSIGAHAVQIAKSMGAHTTCVDRASKEPMLRRLGADDFIDYTQTPLSASGRRWDVIFDMVPDSDYSVCMRLLRPGGRYLVGNPRLAVMARTLITNWFSSKSATFAFARESRAELEELTQMTEAGKIAPIVDRVLPMNEVVEAHRLVETEQRLGAIVLGIA